MTEIKFWHDGQPVPKARPRLGAHGNVYTPERTHAYEQAVGWTARAVMASRAPFAGNVSLKADFYMRGKRRADLDNLIKAIGDGLNGVAWHDDKQVVQIIARVYYDSGKPGVQVVIKEVVG